MEDVYPKDGGSQSGSSWGYSVEARQNSSRPVVIGEQIFDNRWKRVHFQNGSMGVPTAKSYEWAVVQAGLFSYQAAQALRWWFHAEAENTAGGGICTESRIVKHEIKYSISEKAVSHHELIQGYDRSNTLPDWGKATPTNTDGE